MICTTKKHARKFSYVLISTTLTRTPAGCWRQPSSRRAFGPSRVPPFPLKTAPPPPRITKMKCVESGPHHIDGFKPVEYLYIKQQNLMRLNGLNLH